MSFLPQNYAYNLSQPLPRDIAVQHYRSALFRDLRIQRVFVIDFLARVALLTTPMRAISAWRRRDEQLSNLSVQQADSLQLTRSPYLELSGVQPPIDAVSALRYVNILRDGRQGSTALSDHGLSFTAAAVGIEPGNRRVFSSGMVSIEQLPIQDGSWEKMFSLNFAHDYSDTAYISDSIDYTRISQSQCPVGQDLPFILVLMERESDVAMGSAMTTLPDEQGVTREGIQFRNGFGAVWDSSVPFLSLKVPLYSPNHRAVDEINPNRVWAFFG